MKSTLQTAAPLELESTEEEKQKARNVEIDTNLELTPEIVLAQTDYRTSWPVLKALQPFCRKAQWPALLTKHLPARTRNALSPIDRLVLDDMFCEQVNETLTPESLLGRTGSYSRLPVLLTLREFCDTGEWYRLLGESWSICDNIGVYRERMVALFKSDGWEQVEQMMTDEERAARDGLAATITAYRGCYAQNMRGLSYSLDRDIAAGFPLLTRYRPKGQPLLITVKLPRSKAIVKLDREEREVIAVAPRIISVEKLSQGGEQEGEAA